MVFRGKKIREPMVRFYRKTNLFFEPMIDTIGQKWKNFNRGIDTIGSQRDQ
jgi:hypothetical protein